MAWVLTTKRNDPNSTPKEWIATPLYAERVCYFSEQMIMTINNPKYTTDIRDKLIWKSFLMRRLDMTDV